MTTTPEQRGEWMAEMNAARQRLLARIGRACEQGRGVRLSAEEVRIIADHTLVEEVGDAMMEADQ